MLLYGLYGVVHDFVSGLNEGWSSDNGSSWGSDGGKETSGGRCVDENPSIGHSHHSENNSLKSIIIYYNWSYLKLCEDFKQN